MRIIPKEPYKDLHGIITGVNPFNLEERYYLVTNKRTGVIYTRRCPQRTKPFTAAQIASQKQFAENVKNHLYAACRRNK